MVSVATVIAVGVAATGEPQVLGIDVGAAEDYGFWKTFLRSLVRRGIKA